VELTDRLRLEAYAAEEPGFWESLIPIYGPYLLAQYHFGRSEFGWGVVYTGLGVLDIFLAKAAVQAALGGVCRIIGYRSVSLAPVKGGFGVNGRIGSLPTGAESSILKGLYLDQVNSRMFAAKLGIHNTIKKFTSFCQSKWVSRADIRNVLETRTSFRVGASTLHRVGDGFLVGGRESLGYLNRATSHHEMMHIGQYIRNPHVIDTRPFGYIHEVIPSFIGTPELYGGGTIIIGGGLYWWLNSGDN